MKKWIGVDLDGTLAHYEGWKGADQIGEAIPKMLKFVRALISNGYEVKIFTARAYEPSQIPYVREWLAKYGLEMLDITCCKDFGMTMLYDDRCRQVETNTGRLIG